ncbi:MAG: hypothetical protein IPK84_01005 [Candidatus Moraniibacteriota bacterium]|nr:MAG: hypothetical protein IPK84_01005 [Candidatus Moranbacteria bacterium]
MSLKSQELFAEFLANYKPNLPQTVLEKIAEAGTIKKEIDTLKEAIESDDITVRQLKQFKARISELQEVAWKTMPQLSYPDGLRLDPSRIYEEMKRLAQEDVGILSREKTQDLGNLSLVLQLLDGERHVVSLICAWEPIGDAGDAIYKALLDEAGFDEQVARKKYDQLVELRKVEKEE